MENTLKQKSRALLFIVALIVVGAAIFVFMHGNQSKGTQQPSAPQTVPAKTGVSPKGMQSSNLMTIMQSAIASGNLAKCGEIPSEQMRVICQVSVALKSGDSSICEKVTSTRSFPYKSPLTGYSGALSASDFCWMQAVRRTRQDLCSKVSNAMTEECRKEFEAVSKRGQPGMPPVRRAPAASGIPRPPEIPRQSLVPDAKN